MSAQIYKRVRELLLSQDLQGSAAKGADRLPPGGAPEKTAPGAEGNETFALATLAEQVRRYWLQGVLDTAAPPTQRVAIRYRERPDLLANPFADFINPAGPASGTSPPSVGRGEDATPAPSPASTGGGQAPDLAQTFDERGRQMLLLGEPGAGKTTGLLLIARHLMAKFEASATAPLPVVLHLAAWQGEHRGFADWVAAELSLRYRIPRHLGEQLLARGRLLFLLDGLDEVSSGLRKGCAHSIRDWVDSDPSLAFALCCRRADYEHLHVRVPVRIAVQLLPLGDAALEQLWTGMGVDTGLRHRLLADPELDAGARTPLMAKVVASSPPGASADTLFDAYIEALLTRCPPARAGAHPRESLPLLARIGERMTRDSAAQFEIEAIDQRWFPRSWQRQAYALLFGAVLGLVGGLGMAIYWGLLTPILDVRNLGCRPPLLPDGACVAMTELAPLWWVLPPIWGMVLILLDPRLPLTWPGEPALRRLLGETLPVALAYLACWMLLWVTALRLVSDAEPTGAAWMVPLWLSGLCLSLLTAAWRAQRQALTGPVRSVEVLGWTSGRGLLGLIYGGLAGLAIWAINALAVQAWMLQALPADLLFGAVIGLLIGGLRPRLLRDKVRPNEGIRLSLRNALLGAALGLLAGAVAGAASGQIFWQLYSTHLPEAARLQRPGELDFILRYALADAFALSAIAAIWLGGAEVAKHALLRLLLALDGRLPLDIARQLDAACRTGLVQRVGSTWIFSHRLLAEHLARHRKRYEAVG